LKRYLLYLLRWQASTPILVGSIWGLSCLGVGTLFSSVISNLIGGLIFFWIDRLIFIKDKKSNVIPVDDLLLQEIFSLKEKLKISVAAIKNDNPEFDDVKFMHDLNSVDYDQLMEELSETCDADKKDL
jgi:hypothetical protein